VAKTPEQTYKKKPPSKFSTQYTQIHRLNTKQLISLYMRKIILQRNR